MYIDKKEKLGSEKTSVYKNNQELNPAKLPSGFKDKVKQILRKKRTYSGTNYY